MDENSARRGERVRKLGSCASRLEQSIGVVSILPRLQRPTRVVLSKRADRGLLQIIYEIRTCRADIMRETGSV